jgi:hypothetical protein
MRNLSSLIVWALWCPAALFSYAVVAEAGVKNSRQMPVCKFLKSSLLGDAGNQAATHRRLSPAGWRSVPGAATTVMAAQAMRSYDAKHAFASNS